jgi:hypothetical protein
MIKGDFEHPKLTVWDNKIDDEFIFEKDKESDNYYWEFNNTAMSHSFPNNRKSSTMFWGCKYFPSEEIKNQYINLAKFCSTYLFRKKILKINRIFLNGQTLGQDGVCHTDIENESRNEKTLMVYLNHKWDKEWGGEFQVFKSFSDDPEIDFTIDFKPGRIILFDVNLPHRALAPKTSGVLRKSLVFRLITE